MRKDNRDSYDTTAGTGINVDKLLTNIAKEDALGHLRYPNYFMKPNNGHIIAVQNKISKDVKPFAHPIYIDDKRSKDTSVSESAMVIDLRPYTRDDEVRDRTGYSLLVARAELDYVWSHDKSRFKGVTSLALSAYTGYIGESLQRRLMLDPVSQMKVTAILGMYYVWMVTAESGDTWDELRIAKAASQVSRATYIPIDDIIAIFPSDELSFDGTLQNLIYVMQELVTTSRLESLDIPVLYAIVAGGWIGNNGKQTVAIGLEHPPTWIAIVLATLENKTAQRSPLYGVIKRWLKGDVADRYAMSVKSIFIDIY